MDQRSVQRTRTTDTICTQPCMQEHCQHKTVMEALTHPCLQEADHKTTNNITQIWKRTQVVNKSQLKRAARKYSTIHLTMSLEFTEFTRLYTSVE